MGEKKRGKAMITGRENNQAKAFLLVFYEFGELKNGVNDDSRGERDSGRSWDKIFEVLGL